MNSQICNRTLHIHVSTTVPVEDLHQYDTAITGVYAAEVDSTLPDGLAAWAALQAFHEKTGIQQPEDFCCEVFDPETGTYVEQEDPDDEEGIDYRFLGWLADELPRTTLRLTLDVSYLAHGVSVETLTRMLNRMVEEGLGNGMLTGSSKAEVVEHSFEVIQVLDEPEALSPEAPMESRTDYRLSERVKGCWITVDTAAVHIIRTDDGVTVDITANRGRIKPLDSSGVLFSEMEDDICECQGVAIEDVQVQYDFEHPNGPAFDSLPPKKRAEIIERTAKSTAKAVAAIATETKGDPDNSESWQLAQIFASSPLL